MLGAGAEVSSIPLKIVLGGHFLSMYLYLVSAALEIYLNDKYLESMITITI